MKSAIWIILFFIFAVAHAGEVKVIVIPEKMAISKNEDIDVEIFIFNGTSSSVELPKPRLIDGYSSAYVDFKAYAYRINKDKGGLEEAGRGNHIFNSTHIELQKLQPGCSLMYKFKWSSPPGDYDLVVLKPTFLISDFFYEGCTTITIKPQQGGADQPATAPQSNPSDESTPNPESKHRPQ